MNYLLSLFLLSGVLLAGDPFEALLQTTQTHSRSDLAAEKKRLEAFRSGHAQAKKMLNSAKQELDTAIKKSESLNSAIDSNEKNLEEMEETLRRQTGDLGELFGVIRQIAGETKADFEHSVISVHYPQRKNFLADLSESKALPNIEKLETFWRSMLEEMVESSRISKFQSEVVQKDGSYKRQEVIRIGSYGAVSEDAFLFYSPKDNRLVQPQKQLPGRYLASAENFKHSENGFVKIMIDPTRGQLLKMLTQKPDMEERLEQGGVIGKIIIALGIIGLLLALVRYVYLSSQMRILKKQSTCLSSPKEDNALGRIALTYNEHLNEDYEKRSVVIEEVILKEIPQFEKYQPFIKLLAAVSPLLGLLGTVTGMIITFQSITLFGTSDPKLMAGGISTALVTTVLGISMAIPLLFAYTFVAAKSKQIIDLLEHQSVGLIAMEH